MRTRLLLVVAIIVTFYSSNCWSQNAPVISAFSEHVITGQGIAGAILHIKPVSASPEIVNTIPNTGIINFSLTNLVVGEDVVIWQTVGTIDSPKIIMTVITDAQMIQQNTPSTSVSTMAAQGPIGESILAQQLIAGNELLKSTKASYKTTILTTNFTIPVARFDINKTQFDENGNRIENESKGNVSLFSSFGAGIGVCLGRITRTRDSNGEIIDEEFSNTVGLYLGVLYQSGTGDNPKNVFAPTISLSVLDIQIGLGYDYGKVPLNQERMFVTLSYGIPLYKLFNKGYRVWLDSRHKPFDVKRI